MVPDPESWPYLDLDPESWPYLDLDPESWPYSGSGSWVKVYRIGTFLRIFFKLLRLKM